MEDRFAICEAREKPDSKVRIFVLHTNKPQGARERKRSIKRITQITHYTVGMVSQDSSRMGYCYL